MPPPRASNVSTLVTNSAVIDEVGSEIQAYETVKGAKINRDKSSTCVWICGNGLSRPPSVGRANTRFWLGPDFQLMKNWSEILEKIVATVNVAVKETFLEEKSWDVCYPSGMCLPLILYRLSVMPLPFTPPSFSRESIVSSPLERQIS